MSAFLAQACAEARDRVAAAVRTAPLGAVRERAEARPRPPGFAASLLCPDVAVIAEIKRASPSRGHLTMIPDPAALAAGFAAGGAAAISVLTEPNHFAGSLEDLERAAGAVELPVLRKDFVVDPYQVWEARAAGAAAVLLIVAALEQEQLAELLAVAAKAGVDALVETHEEHEVSRATGAAEASGAERQLIVGVNARDLTSLQVDAGRFAALRAAIPDGAIAVAESGVRDAGDVERLRELGADAVLVGEAVASAPDPTDAVRRLVAAGRRLQRLPR